MSDGVEWGPWIGWNGGECPVDDETMVEVVTKHGSTTGTASDYCWSLKTIAYRVKKDPVVEVRVQTAKVVTTLGHDYLGQINVYQDFDAQCTYTNGKLTKIHWEADQ